VIFLNVRVSTHFG